jgi:hypothetical protein
MATDARWARGHKEARRRVRPRYRDLISKPAVSYKDRLRRPRPQHGRSHTIGLLQTSSITRRRGCRLYAVSMPGVGIPSRIHTPRPSYLRQIKRPRGERVDAPARSGGLGGACHENVFSPCIEALRAVGANHGCRYSHGCGAEQAWPWWVGHRRNGCALRARRRRRAPRLVGPQAGYLASAAIALTSKPASTSPGRRLRIGTGSRAEGAYLHNGLAVKELRRSSRVSPVDLYRIPIMFAAPPSRKAMP